MDPTLDLAAIQAYNDQQAAVAEKAYDQGFEASLTQAIKDQIAISGAETQQAIVVAITALINTIIAHQPEVSVKNPTPAVSLDALTASINSLIEETKHTNERLDSLLGKETDFGGVIETLTNLEAAIDRSAASRPTPPTSIEVLNQPDFTPHFDNLTATLTGLSMNQQAPIVNAPPPDLTPIQQQLQANSSKVLPPSLNLATYRAQDIDEADPDSQFIGFMNLEGYWYIMKNDTKNNTLRYHFGYGNYENAWGIAPALDYLPLESAIKSISQTDKKKRREPKK